MTVTTSTLPRQRSTLVLIGAAIAAFISVLNGTTVTASLEPLSEALGSTLDAIIWVTTAYLVAASLALPLMGWLTDRYGVRRVLLVSIAGFTAGSMLCALAWDVPSLIGFRVVQGLAGGMLEPTAITIVAMAAPKERLGRVMGLLSLVINGGPVLGPICGALLLDAGGWSWIFLINVPFGVVVAYIAWRYLDPATGEHAGVRVDLTGVALLPAGFVLVLLGINRAAAGDPGWLTWPLVGAGLLLVGLYLRHALTMSGEPLVDVRLFRFSGFAAAIAIMAGIGLVMYSQLTVLPLFGGAELDLGTISRTLPVTVFGVGLAISMTIAGNLADKVGPRSIVRAAAIASAGVAALVVLIRTSSDSPWPTVGMLFVAGLTFGATASPTFAAIYRTLPEDKIAQGTTSAFIVVQLFASAGVVLVAAMSSIDGDVMLPAYAVVGAFGVAAGLLARWLPASGSSGSA